MKVDFRAPVSGILAGDVYAGPADVQTGDFEVTQFRQFNGDESWPRRDFQHVGAGTQARSDGFGLPAEVLHFVASRARVPAGDKSLHSGALVTLLSRGVHDLFPSLCCVDSIK